MNTEYPRHIDPHIGPTMETRTHCLICACPKLETTWREGGSEIQTCYKCGFSQVRSIPSDPKFYHELYNQKISAELIDSLKERDCLFEDILAEIQKLKIPPAKLLDIGPLTGRLILKAMEQGLDARGVEINDLARKYLRKEKSLKIYQSLDQVIEKVDIITLIDCLEHIPRPKAYLHELTKFLNIDGILVIKVPHYPIQKAKQSLLKGFKFTDLGLIHNFRHVNHFSKKSLIKLVESLGLKVEIIKSSQMDLSTLRRYSRFKNFKKALEFSNQMIKLIDRLVPGRLGPHLLIIGRKNAGS